MLSRSAAALALGVAALAACSSDPQDATHAVHTDGGWVLQSAVDLAADDPLATVERPALDWYAEYVSPDFTEMVRLSGHEAGAREARTELEEYGFAFDDIDVDGHDGAVAGRHPDDEAGPELLVVPSGERTLLLLSYDVGPEALVEFMESVEVVTLDEWVEDGGVVD